MNVQEEKKNHQERNELPELFDELGVVFFLYRNKAVKTNEFVLRKVETELEETALSKD